MTLRLAHLLRPCTLLQLQPTKLARCASTAAPPASTHHSQRSVRRRQQQQQQFQHLELALCAFRARYGHIAVPLRYTIPVLPPVDNTTTSKSTATTATNNSEHAWPDALQGMKLGTTLSRFVKVAHKPEHARLAAALTALGVPVDTVDGDWRRFLWDHVTVKALQTFHARHNHFFVPYAFTVPLDGNDNDSDNALPQQWPRQTWGYKLGYWVTELRRDKSRLAPHQLQDLHAMRFVWSAREAQWNQFFVPAMQTFAALYGADARVPQSFVVPLDGGDDGQWPAALRGYRLGQKVNNLRVGASRTHRRTALDKRCRNVGDGNVDDSAGVEWDDVELVYNNWMLLDLLHESEQPLGDDEDSSSSDSRTSSEDATTTRVVEVKH